jgi:hypothetical protein
MDHEYFNISNYYYDSVCTLGLVRMGGIGISQLSKTCGTGTTLGYDLLALALLGEKEERRRSTDRKKNIQPSNST